VSLRQLAVIVAVPALVVACNDDEDVDDVEPIVEPQASIGEPVVYRGALGTDVEWELTVTVEDIECDIEVGDETEVAAADDRLCAVGLRLENTGEHPNVEAFSQASSLITDTGEMGLSNVVGSELYIEEEEMDLLVGVAPGEVAETALLFNVAEGEEPMHLQLQAGADDDIVLIDLTAETDAGRG
jgi:hypothetical protein